MKRNKFSLSNTRLLSGEMGQLIPVNLLHVIPGDSIQSATTCMLRMAPMLAPVMHATHMSISSWFIPHRLVWEDFEDFITGGPDNDDASVFPTIDTPASTGFAVGSLADYLGVPPGVASRPVSALPFRVYALLYNEFFRDQDLQTPLAISVSSGTDTTISTAIQNVNWEKDYFTTARPWEQKGPAITIPIGDSAPVVSDGNAFNFNVDGTNRNSIAQAGGSNVQFSGANGGGTAIKFGTSSGLEADLSSASAITINLLREAFALQRFSEARARFGSRYVEYLRYLGVRSSDARLQRPEFLGGGRYPVQYSEVLSTAETEDTPVGSLKGHGIGVARNARFRRFFEEHGYMITVMHVRPKTIYMDGLERHWNYRTKEDFWQKELQHIGQQEVLNKEVRFAHATPDGVFGYQDRYDELRRAWSSVSGEFRTTLDFWHFARSFSSDPALNNTFVKCVPIENPFAVQSTNTLYVMARNSVQARRLVASSGSSFIY